MFLPQKGCEKLTCTFRPDGALDRNPAAPRFARLANAAKFYYTLFRGKYRGGSSPHNEDRPTARLRAVANGTSEPPPGPSLDRQAGDPGRSDRPARALHRGGPVGVDPSAPQHRPRTSGRVVGRPAGRSYPGSGGGPRAP